MSVHCPPTRRDVLRWGALAASGAALGPLVHAAARTAADTPPAGLPTRLLGQTGRRVCMLALGTGTIAHGRRPTEVVDVVTHALDAGITFVDTAQSYNAEAHIGRAIAGRRQGLFLATKTLERDYDGAMRELDGSLKALGTDHLELWQVHSIGHAGADSATELRHLRDARGVLRAMRRAKEQGVVDFIGFTGHTTPQLMLDVLAATDLAFDTMLFTISAALARQRQRGWEDDVLPAGRRRNLGRIAMKVYGGGRAVGRGGQQAPPAELLKYVWDLGLPVANVGLNTKEEVDAAVAACRAYAAAEPPAKEPLSDETARAEFRARFAGLELPFEAPGYVDVRPRV